MAGSRLLYYITDRTAFPGNEYARRQRLLEKIAEAARCGVDYIQLREKDLSGQELESLAREVVRTVRDAGKSKTALLINSRRDIALAVGADGVHLRSDDVAPSDVRLMWQSGTPVVGVSCHSREEVELAANGGARFAVFAPVFGKKDSTRVAGHDLLAQACAVEIPIFALGGVTLENAQSCLALGAAGIAGIRLFQETDVAEVIRRLR